MSPPGEKEKKKEGDTKLHDGKRKNNKTCLNNEDSIKEQGIKKGTNENTKENKETDSSQKKEIESDVGKKGSDDVFCSIGSPCPEFGILYWGYNINTAIVDYL